MKQFVKVLLTEADCFKYLISAFPSQSFEKIEAGVFDGPQIRQLVKDSTFTSEQCKKFKDTVKDLLGNTLAQNLRRNYPGKS